MSSRSASRSGSESGSASSDSMSLPARPEEYQTATNGAGAPLMPHADDNGAAATAAGEGGPASDEVTVFIGLGPGGRGIKSEEFRVYLEGSVTAPEMLGGVRMRGRSAFVDVKGQAEAERLVAQLDGKMFDDKTRMVVQLSKHTRAELSERRREREDKAKARSATRAAAGERPALFIGLGPAGGAISDERIRAKCEEVCPVQAFRRHGQCVFIEVASAALAERCIAELNNQYLGECRLTVQYSRDRGDKGEVAGRKRERGGRGALSSSRGGGGAPDRQRDGRRGRGDRDRSRSPSRRRGRRHRSDSRDRRRRRSHSSSGSSSYARSRSRGRRGGYSSASSSSVDSRDRRDRRRGGERYRSRRN